MAYGTRVKLCATYYGVERWNDGEPGDVRITFPRIVKSQNVEAFALALINANIGFSFDPARGDGNRKEIRLSGWSGMPSLSEIKEALNAHGFTYEDVPEIHEARSGKDVTSAVLDGSYREPEPEAQA